jgi:RsiW-degrading membrane proteinase PrsW (M82 family)
METMTLAFVAVSAVVPSLLLIWYFHSRDVYPEPQKVIWATFGLSVLSVIPVLAVALPISLGFTENVEGDYLGGLADAFLTAAIPEEIFKFLVVYFYAARHEAFDEPMDGIVYGVVGSLGFATLENVLYTMRGGIGVAVMRALTAVPGHAFMGAIMGYYIGQARFNAGGRKKRLLFAALFWPILLHGLYDFPLLTLKRINPDTGAMSEAETLQFVALLGLTVAVLVTEWVWAVRVTKRLRRAQKAQQAAERAAATPAVAAVGAVPSVARGSAVPAALSAPAPSAPSASAASAGRSSSRWAPVLMGFGGLFSSLGGLVCLGVGLAAVLGEVDGGELGPVLTAVVVVGVLPLALGTWMFVSGLRRLPKPAMGT